jgi:integrase
MGSVAFEAKGIDWRHEIPLNISFALRLNEHATPIERQIMLYAIEQSLMPAETGKRYEYETAVAAGDALSAHFHDYDWADEVLHAQIGRRMLKREGISSDEARERAKAIHEQTWAALDRYRSLEEQRDWWPAFVKKVLGRDSAAGEKPGLNMFSE